MFVDKRGIEIKVGDKVSCIGMMSDEIHSDAYEFTIEVIRDDGWVWGSDLPQPYCSPSYGHDSRYESDLNYHNWAAIIKISDRKSITHEGSKLKFNFV